MNGSFITHRLRGHTPILGLLCLLVPLSLATLGCGSGSGGESAGHEEHGDHGGEEHEGHGHDDHAGHDHGDNSVIVVDDATIERGGILVEELSETAVSETFNLPGTVRPSGDGIAKVGTLLPGRIAAMHVREGSYVAKGARLAEIETVEIGEARAEYLDAVARENRAKQAMDRQTRLAGEQIGAQRSLEEASTEYKQAKALRQEAEVHLKSLGISPEEAGSNFSNRMVVHAPISGVVSERHVTLGQFAGFDTDLFTLVNTGVVWIDAEASPAQAARLNKDADITIRLPSAEPIPGKLIFISPMVTESSRTVRIRIEAKNRDGILRPGAFVTAEFHSDGTERGFVIPERGIERGDDGFYVYRQHSPHEFERVRVDAREGPEGSMILTGGVQAGDAIAVSGVFYIKSIMAGDELSEHNHSH